MRPRADVGQSAREGRVEGSSFRDSEDSRPSPNFPRGGDPRSARSEQTEQQRLTIDWDAAAGSFSGEEIAYSAYLNPEGSSEQYLVQMQDIHENLTGSMNFRSRSPHPSRSSEPEHVNLNGVSAEGRTPAEYRLPRETWQHFWQILANFSAIFYNKLSFENEAMSTPQQNSNSC